MRNYFFRSSLKFVELVIVLSMWLLHRLNWFVILDECSYDLYQRHPHQFELVQRNVGKLCLCLAISIHTVGAELREVLEELVRVVASIDDFRAQILLLFLRAHNNTFNPSNCRRKCTDKKGLETIDTQISVGFAVLVAHCFCWVFLRLLRKGPTSCLHRNLLFSNQRPAQVFELFHQPFVCNDQNTILSF